MSHPNSSGVGPLATAARQYQSLGLSVLPWKYDEKKGKRPTRKWDVAEHAPMSADEITSWWRMYPDHNVGVITGPTGMGGTVRTSDIVVLDLDTPEALAWAAQHLPPTPWRMTTGRGGGAEHRGYRYPLNLPADQYIKTCSGALGVPGLDVRGVGGFVGMAPSLHKSGRNYQWVGTFPDPTTLPMLDTSVLPATIRKEEVDEEDHDLPASDLRVQRAIDWLSQQAPAIEGQGGDRHTFRICASLRRGFALTMSQAQEVIAPWNARCEPPWDEADLDRKLLKGRTDGDEVIGRRGNTPPLEEIVAALQAVIADKGLPPLDVQEAPTEDADPLTVAREVALQAPGDAVIDVGAPFTPDALKAAAILRKQDMPAFYRMRAELRTLGGRFSLRDWEKAVLKESKAASGGRKVIDDAERERIVLSGDEKTTCDLLLDVLKKAPNIYVRDNTLCFIEGGEVLPLQKAKLRNAVLQHCTVVRSMLEKGTDDYVDVAAPIPNNIIDMLSALLPAQIGQFRVVDQLASYPFCSVEDGVYRIVTEEGYDEATRTVLSNCPGVNLRRFPKVSHAAEYLKWIVKDFPFASDAERDNLIGAMLTVVVRPAMYNGVSPLVIIEGNQQNVGKSLLAKLLVAVAMPGEPNVTPWPDEGVKEASKKLLPILRRSQAAHFWDNVRGHIESTTLEGTLTSSVISLRTLGYSSDETYKNVTLWGMTSNNMSTNKDTARRAVRVRLVELSKRSPEIKDFKQFIQRERPVILAALLRLVEHWIDNGAKFYDNLPHIGSFEEWSTLVGAIMHEAGFAQWMTNHKEAELAMSQGDDWAQFVNAWYDAYKGEPTTLAQLWVLCQKANLLGHVLAEGGDKQQQVRLGELLSSHHESVTNSKQLRCVQQRATGPVYQLVIVGLTAVSDPGTIQNTAAPRGAVTSNAA